MTDLEWVLTMAIGPVAIIAFLQFIASGKQLDESWARYLNSISSKKRHTKPRKRGK